MLSVERLTAGVIGTAETPYSLSSYHGTMHKSWWTENNLDLNSDNWLRLPSLCIFTLIQTQIRGPVMLKSYKFV